MPSRTSGSARSMIVDIAYVRYESLSSSSIWSSTTVPMFPPPPSPGDAGAPPSPSGGPPGVSPEPAPVGESGGVVSSAMDASRFQWHAPLGGGGEGGEGA